MDHGTRAAPMWMRECTTKCLGGCLHGRRAERVASGDSRSGRLAAVADATKTDQRYLTTTTKIFCMGTVVSPSKKTTGSMARLLELLRLSADPPHLLQLHP